MQQHGIKTSIWGQNLAVWSICSILLLAYARSPQLLLSLTRVRLSTLLLLIATLFIALPLFSTGIDGVHRWIVIGGFRLHTASFAAPLFLAMFQSAQRRLFWPLALIFTALLIVQPDAAEATGFILASFFFIARPPPSRATLSFGSFCAAISLIYAWLRPDPLAAVPHVEGIVGLATALHPILGFSALAFLALLLLPFVIISKYSLHPHHSATAAALGFYFTGKLLGTLCGNFPVPLMGYSASAIIGYFIALAAILPKAPPASANSTSQNQFRYI